MMPPTFDLLHTTVYWLETQILPKAKQAQSIEYFDSFNILSSKQKLQQALKSWSNFSLGFFSQGREMHKKRQSATVDGALTLFSTKYLFWTTFLQKLT